MTFPESSFHRARLVVPGLALSALGLAADAQTYVQEAKLLASDGVANQRAGMALAVYGNTAVVGAPLSNVGGRTAEGAAYVYVRTSTTWSFGAKLTEFDGGVDNNEADHFGAAVAIFGDTIAVGAPRNPAPMAPQSGFANRGAVYVFKLEGGTWTFKQKIASMDATLGDLFGSAVALSADALLVGAPFAPTPSATHPDTGAAYVYDLVPPFDQRAKLIPPMGVAYDEFGAAVSLAGNVALIGAPGTDSGAKADSGAAYVFERSTAISWPLKGQLAASDGAANHKFGSAIAAAADRLVVGAPNATVGGKINQGAAYVFARNAAGWAEDGKLVATDGSALDSSRHVGGVVGRSRGCGRTGRRSRHHRPRRNLRVREGRGLGSGGQARGHRRRGGRPNGPRDDGIEQPAPDERPDSHDRRECGAGSRLRVPHPERTSGSRDPDEASYPGPARPGPVRPDPAALTSRRSAAIRRGAATARLPSRTSRRQCRSAAARRCESADSGALRRSNVPRTWRSARAMLCPIASGGISQSVSSSGDVRPDGYCHFWRVAFHSGCNRGHRRTTGSDGEMLCRECRPHFRETLRSKRRTRGKFDVRWDRKQQRSPAFSMAAIQSVPARCGQAAASPRRRAAAKRVPWCHASGRDAGSPDRGSPSAPTTPARRVVVAGKAAVPKTPAANERRLVEANDRRIRRGMNRIEQERRRKVCSCSGRARVSERKSLPPPGRSQGGEDQVDPAIESCGANGQRE